MDGSGNMYVAGYTYSANFPGAGAGSLQPANAGAADGYLTEISATGASQVFSTYLGGSGFDGLFAITLDGSRNIFVAGGAETGFPVTPGAFQTTYSGNTDAVVAKLAPLGTSITWATYLGGSDSDVVFTEGIKLDDAGNVWTSGFTFSSDFPTASPIQSSYRGFGEVFVSKLNPSGAALPFSTYLGGSSSRATSPTR